MQVDIMCPLMGNKESKGGLLALLPESLRGKLGFVSDPSSSEAILAQDHPQTLQPEFWDEVGFQIVGRIEGDIREVGGSILQKSETQIEFSRPVQTQFVQVINDQGETRIQRFDPQLHGAWQDIHPIGWIEKDVAVALGIPLHLIPNKGMSPQVLLNHLEGFAIDETQTQAEQFQKERKKARGASRTKWETTRHPVPKKISR